MAKIEIEFTDRYQALGIPRPDGDCQGECEATGFVPVHRNEKEEPWKSLWEDAEKKSPTDDNYHFVTCPRCNGTRKEP